MRNNSNKLKYIFPKSSLILSYVRHKLRKMFLYGDNMHLPIHFDIVNNELILEYDYNFSESDLRKIQNNQDINEKKFPSYDFFLPKTPLKIDYKEKNETTTPYDLVFNAEKLNEQLLLFHYNKSNNNLLLINKKVQNNCFPSFKLPKIQELWENIISSQKTTPTIRFFDNENLDIFSEDFFNLKSSDWIGTDIDKQSIKIGKIRDLKNQGYFTTVDIGTYILMKRKEKFTNYFKSNQHFNNAINNKYRVVHSELNRKSLPDVIAQNKGIFLVQGPPGTGKTYLASQVIHTVLRQNKDARILVVSKEHLALNHLLEVSLKDLNSEVLATRILNTSKYFIYANKDIEDFLISSQIKKLKSSKWLDGFKFWETTFSTSPSLYDMRIKKLVIEASNILFVTSMDSEWDRILGKQMFDLVIVEEASKAYPSELFHCVSVGINTLLIGDQQQLPPYQSKEIKLLISDIEEIVKNNSKYKKCIDENLINQSLLSDKTF